MNHQLQRDPARHGVVPIRARAAGFTLVELMVAMVIGLLMLLALSTLFLSTSRTNNEMAKTNGLIENGRFAIQLIESDLVHAGFWGEHVPQFDNLTFDDVPDDAPGAVPAPCLAYADWPTDAAALAALNNQLIGIPVQAYDATPAGCTLANRLDESDVLLVRHAETCVPGEGNCQAEVTGRLYFQASLCASDPVPYLLSTTGFGLAKRACDPGDPADKRRFISNLYYVRDYARTIGDGIPTLMRMSFDAASGFSTEALIEGIEGLRVELGIDDRSRSGDDVNYSEAVAWPDPSIMAAPMNRGDGVPDEFVRCTSTSPCSAAQLTNTVAVKLFLLARSLEGTPGYSDSKTYCLGTPNADASCPADSAVSFDDNVKRHAFTATIRLNNVSGRRETP